MFESCLEKQQKIKDFFSSCKSSEEKYQKIIELGRRLPHLAESDKTPEYLVKGCQSQMFLKSSLENGKIQFQADSDALISGGLAALLILVYNDETPESVLKCPPAYLDELSIGASLSPNRANGLYQIHLRMKQDALKWFILSK